MGDSDYGGSSKKKKRGKKRKQGKEKKKKKRRKADSDLSEQEFSGDEDDSNPKPRMRGGPFPPRQPHHPGVSIWGTPSEGDCYRRVQVFRCAGESSWSYFWVIFILEFGA